MTGVDSGERGPPAQVCVTLISLGGNKILEATIAINDKTGKTDFTQVKKNYFNGALHFTAIDGSDYTPVPLMNLTISIPGDVQCVNISITDDSLLEETETLTAGINTQQDNGVNSTLLISIGITDDDGQCVDCMKMGSIIRSHFSVKTSSFKVPIRARFHCG